MHAVFRPGSRVHRGHRATGTGPAAGAPTRQGKHPSIERIGAAGLAADASRAPRQRRRYRRALTFAETCAMSARPASVPLSAAIALPISAGPLAPDVRAAASAASIAWSISASDIRAGR